MQLINRAELNDSILKDIAQEISTGKTCIYPTETCYGLGTSGLDAEALEKIYELKRRERAKKLTCVVASIGQAKNYCYLSEIEEKLCRYFMPGPLTVVAEKKRIVPDILNNRFAFRIPSSEIARKLARFSNVPIVATSANISGQDNSYTIDSISEELRDGVDYVIDYGRLDGDKPSSIVMVKEDRIEMLRRGPIVPEAIEEAIGMECTIV